MLRWRWMVMEVYPLKGHHCCLALYWVDMQNLEEGIFGDGGDVDEDDVGMGIGDLQNWWIFDGVERHLDRVMVIQVGVLWWRSSEVPISRPLEYSALFGRGFGAK
jgi:hypothetical protein